MKINQIQNVEYGEGNISCEPKEEDILKASNEDLEVRAFQQDIKQLDIEWGNGVERRSRVKAYHARRIAYFVFEYSKDPNFLSKDPILLCNDRHTILDGLHRLKAAIYLKMEEVDVVVTNAARDISSDKKNELWSAINRYKNYKLALSSVDIIIIEE